MATLEGFVSFGMVWGSQRMVAEDGFLSNQVWEKDIGSDSPPRTKLEAFLFDDLQSKIEWDKGLVASW